MDEFLLSAAAFVLLMVALGLVRVARGPGYADRMMAAQLLGTGGIAALLLVGAAVGAQFGAKLAMRIDPARLRLVLAVIVLLVALRMFLGLVWRPDEIYTIQWL